MEERGCEPPPAVSGELGVTPGTPIVCVDVFCGVRGAGFQMDKAGRELRDRRRRLRQGNGRSFSATPRADGALTAASRHLAHLRRLERFQAPK